MGSGYRAQGTGVKEQCTSMLHFYQLL
uniref:Uncharacterized protein n=1 Tax=Anguilla anguilla TaxID=7936 RepID=A0A0E9TI21_ANGAN